MSKTKHPAEGAVPGDLAGPGTSRPSMRIDESHLAANYANFCRITGTPDELIIDFGLNPQPYGPGGEPIVAGQRIVTSYVTAKRLLHALQLSIQRHEMTFGPVEMDVQKRIVKPEK